MEGEIDYDGLSDDEEEDLQSQQQGMCGNKNKIMKVWWFGNFVPRVDVSKQYDFYLWVWHDDWNIRDTRESVAFSYKSVPVVHFYIRSVVW